MNVAPQIARAVRVPFVANSVAPLRLAYGELDVEAPAERFDSYTALYFLVDGDGSLGRVTFEGLDAVRAARGEILPYGLAAPLRADDWVFTVDPSLWLAERDEYEVKQYSTPLLGTHQH